VKNGAIDKHIAFFENIWLERFTAQTRLKWCSYMDLYLILDAKLEL
jgi:hypothetical protein